ncbi:TetR/AcrR family transcriptional regulator [Burkholderia ubonensis]|uniref:TetR/AcrR family transcriptional regulator n=1 Tax=Burkholderia ubonensis TaxID=101571 RepID=UPI0007579C72|nr:TetR/AcrR family transcriptional regulator [Burkholderia ubonensis]KWN76899.1 TetR family transcriptional regulator [Burkholderia ubonensis]
MPMLANSEVRKRLLNDGGRIIYEMGFIASGVQDIVAAADVPKGAFYSYFDSKEVFVAEVLQTYWESIESRHGHVMRDARIKPLNRIEKFFALLAEDHAANEFRLGCLIGNLSVELANASTEIRDALRCILQRWEGSIAACLAEAKTGGELHADREPAQVAAIIVESWCGAILRCKVQRSGSACHRFLRVTLKRFLY